MSPYVERTHDAEADLARKVDAQRRHRPLRTVGGGKPTVLHLGDTVFLHAGIQPDRAPRRLEDIDTQVLAEIKLGSKPTPVAALRAKRFTILDEPTG